MYSQTPNFSKDNVIANSKSVLPKLDRSKLHPDLARDLEFRDLKNKANKVTSYYEDIFK